MSFFRNIRPRRFSHTFIYIDERRERLRAIERRAAENLSAEGRGETRHEKEDVRRDAGFHLTRPSGPYARHSFSGLVMLLLFLFILFIALISFIINF